MTRLVNEPIDDITNRLSDLQRGILQFLAIYPPPATTHIGGLPRTNDIIRGIGRTPNEGSYAAVCRSLSRLTKAGLIHGYQGELAIRGKGRRWSLAA